MRRLLVLMLALAVTCGPAAAQDRATASPSIPGMDSAIARPDTALGRRVALVIGNSAYQHTPPLANPRNDAADLAAVLRKLGFEVVEGKDLDKAGMDRTIRNFATSLANARAALFYYAGHGLQVGGQNYLVPVDAQLSTAAALDFEMIRLDLVQRTMERETTTNILVLDACRDNPLARNLARALGTRSTQIGRGLAAAESGEGTLISFSTQPGNVALDGAGRNSPFAAALIGQISQSGEDLSSLLVNVRNDVMKATDRRQVPWEHSALTAKFYFSAPRPSGPTPEQQIEIAFWASVKDSTSPDVLRSYLARYPDGAFSGVANALIQHLVRQAAAEQASREERRRRDEEAIKAEELKRLEEQRRAREAVLFDERRRAEEAKNLEEVARLREQQAAELLAQSEELRKLHLEVQAARTAAQQAEQQRLTAVVEARRAAEEAQAALNRQIVLEAGPRPAAHADIQIDGRFTEQDAQRVRTIAERHGLILPDFRFEVPDASVPDALRRFIGIWVEETGKNNTSRKLMLIATKAYANGGVDGYWLYGPPGPKSWNQNPASTFKFEGMITDGVLRFISPGKTAYRLTLEVSTGVLKYHAITRAGDTDTRILRPVWQLVPQQSSDVKGKSR